MAIERVNFGGKEILLLGTAHVSGKSVEEARKAIEEERPDIVGVELDAQRLNQLRQGRQWLETDIMKIVSTGQTHLFLLTLMLSNLQRAVGEKLGVKAGMEMIEAVRAAEEKKLPVMLLDRDVGITMKRAMQKMTLLEKAKMAGSVVSGFFGEGKEALTSDGIEKLKEKDIMNRLMQELSREMPSVKEVLVDERDSYIAQSIVAAPGKRILAVVGAGHVEGIKLKLGKPVDIPAIMKVEKGADYAKAIGYLIPLVFFGLIVALLLTKGSAVTLTAIAYWIAATGTLAAIGTLAAGGHPLSVIAAFLAAPITTLHPLLAAGWVAGYVEARIRSPKVKDFEGLRSLNSLGDFTKNQVTRILLVVALANIGATIGAVIGVPLLASMLK